MLKELSRINSESDSIQIYYYHQVAQALTMEECTSQ